MVKRHWIKARWLPILVALYGLSGTEVWTAGGPVFLNDRDVAKVVVGQDRASDVERKWGHSACLVPSAIEATCPICTM